MRLCLLILLSACCVNAAAREPRAKITEDRELKMDWGKLTVWGVAASADGGKVAVVARSDDGDKAAGRIVVFDFQSGKVGDAIETDERLRQVAWGKDEQLITRGESVRIWDLKTKQATRTIGEKELGGPVRAMAVSASGKLLAVAAKSVRPVTVFELAGGEGKALWEETEPVEVNSLSFDGVDEKLAVGGYKGRIGRVFDVRSKKLLQELEMRGVREMSNVIMSRDGLCVAACTPGLMEGEGVIYNVKTGGLGSTLSSMRRGPVHPLALSPDGMTLVTVNPVEVGRAAPEERLSVYLMYGGLYFAYGAMSGPVSAADFVDDGTIVVASKDLKGQSRVTVHQLTLEPNFKAGLAAWKMGWINRSASGPIDSRVGRDKTGE